MLLTLGGLGIWALLDVFFIGKRVRHLTEQIELEVITPMQAMGK
jgi:hypothetical protein